MSKRIIFRADGTWNGPYEEQGITHIRDPKRHPHKALTPIYHNLDRAQLVRPTPKIAIRK
mgnify:CR=1 FL=1